MLLILGPHLKNFLSSLAILVWSTDYHHHPGAGKACILTQTLLEIPTCPAEPELAFHKIFRWFVRPVKFEKFCSRVSLKEVEPKTENMLWGVVRGGTSMNNTNPGSWPWHFPGKSCLRNWLYAPVVNSNYQASYLWYLDMLWVKWKLFSRVLFFVTSWTIQFIEFSWPEYWSGYPFPSPVDLPNPETEPRSPTLQADSLPA